MEEARSEKSLKDIALDTRVYMCVDCAKCTGSCPIGIAGEIYSPRSVVQHALLDGRDPVLSEIWRCLTCGTCKVRCPSDVDYPEFIRSMREIALDKHLLPQHTHGGVRLRLPSFPKSWLITWRNLSVSTRSSRTRGFSRFPIQRREWWLKRQGRLWGSI